jgi:hypothetical protein
MNGPDPDGGVDYPPDPVAEYNAAIDEYFTLIDRGEEP